MMVPTMPPTSAAAAPFSTYVTPTLGPQVSPTYSKTAFPEFGLPDLELTEGSEEEDSVAREMYSTKEDQDVAVFMAISEKLRLTSLLHLLQGHVRSTQSHVWEYDTIIALKAAVDKEERLQNKPLAKRKMFRFAEISGGVRCVVHEIESWKSEPLWWTSEEMMDMRVQAIATVKHFRQHRKKFAAAVETVAESSTEKTDVATVEAAVQQLIKDNFARGLETHICSFLSRIRSETVAAVLEEQNECRMCKDSYELTCESLRGQSLAYSKVSRTFAKKMGQCDQVEALKATMSKWRPAM